VGIFFVTLPKLIEEIRFPGLIFAEITSPSPNPTKLKITSFSELSWGGGGGADSSSPVNGLIVGGSVTTGGASLIASNDAISIHYPLQSDS